MEMLQRLGLGRNKYLSEDKYTKLSSKKMKMIFSLLIFCGIFNTLNATDYYVSFSLGDDNNDGLSTATPWKTTTKVVAKSIASQPFQPGDNIYFKRGDAWEGELRIFSIHGTESSPITFTAYGEGEDPIIYSDCHSAAWSAVANHPGVYSAYVGQNFVTRAVYDGANALTPITTSFTPNDLDNYLNGFTAGSFGPYGNSSTGVVYVKTFDGNSPDSDYRIFSAGITVKDGGGSSYLIFENFQLRNALYGIIIDFSDNIIIRNNTIEDILNIGVYLRYGAEDCLVENNTINRTGNDALYAYGTVNTIFRGNYFSDVTDNVLGITTHGDQCGIGLQESTGTLVEYNNGCNIIGSCVDYYYDEGSIVRYNYFANSGGGAYPHGTNITLCYNIFNIQWESGIGGGTNSGNTGAGYVLIYNNIFYGIGSYGLMSVDNGEVEFYNNIVYTSQTGGKYVSFGGTGIISRNNCFYGNGLYRYNGVYYNTLQDYQNASGLDTNSVSADPCFAFGTSPQTASDFQLTTGSPCINAGYDLSSIVSEYQDFNQIAVPQDSIPDIGVHEGTVLFYDNSEAETIGSVPSQWNAGKTDLDWEIVNDNGNKVIRISGLPTSYDYGDMWVGTSNSNAWSDYEIKLKFKFLNEGSSAYVSFLCGGPSTPSAYIRFHTSCPGTYARLVYNGTVNGVRPTFPDGSYGLTSYYSSAGFENMQDDTWYQLRIIADAQTNNVKIYISKAGEKDSEVKLFDTPVVLTNGTVGLAVWADEIYYDDIEIKKVSH